MPKAAASGGRESCRGGRPVAVSRHQARRYRLVPHVSAPEAPPPPKAIIRGSSEGGIAGGPHAPRITGRPIAVKTTSDITRGLGGGHSPATSASEFRGDSAMLVIDDRQDGSRFLHEDSALTLAPRPPVNWHAWAILELCDGRRDDSVHSSVVSPAPQDCRQPVACARTRRPPPVDEDSPPTPEMSEPTSYTNFPAREARDNST